MSSVDALPFAAAVIGTKQAAFLGFNEGVNAPAIGCGHGHTDFAPDAFGQTVWFFVGFTGGITAPAHRVRRGPGRRARRDELLPGVAAVTGNIQAGAGAAAGHFPRAPPHWPQPW